MNNLVGLNCLITGTSRGLGRQLAGAFWDEGASLFLVARSTKILSDLAEHLPSRVGQQMHCFGADLEDPSAPDLVVAAARDAFGRLDVLVNNAGIQGPIGHFWENDWAAWHATFQVNFLSPAALCKACVQWMAENRGGKIINLSGGGAASPRPNFTAYAASKAALVRFSETLAEETRSLGIEINCIAPGGMNTAMQDAILKAGPELAGQREFELAREASRAVPDRVERAIALCQFLASHASDGITGKLLSALWDPWEQLPEHLAELDKTDIYTLRRIVPRDRGCDWGG